MHTMNAAAPKRPGRYAQRIANGRPAVTVSLPDKTLETLDELMKLTRETRSAVIVEAVEQLARRKGVL